MTELKTAEETLKALFKKELHPSQFASINDLQKYHIEKAMNEHARQWIKYFAKKASWLHEKEIREIRQDILKQLK